MKIINIFFYVYDTQTYHINKLTYVYLWILMLYYETLSDKNYEIIDQNAYIFHR